MSPQLRGLSGKNVIVTGAARGVGYSCSIALADAGANVALLDTPPQINGLYPLATRELLDEAVADVANLGVSAVGCPCDLRDEQQVAAADQGAFAGRAIIAWSKNEPSEAYRAAPYFWSDLYGRRLQVVGVPSLAESAEYVLGAPGDDAFLLEYRAQGALVAVAGMNVQGRILRYRRELDAVPA